MTFSSSSASGNSVRRALETTSRCSWPYRPQVPPSPLQGWSLPSPLWLGAQSADRFYRGICLRHSAKNHVWKHFWILWPSETSMLLGSMAITNQMGFIFIFSIVVDTFVVRTVLVPAMLSLNPRLNYWPSHMPDVKITWLGKWEKEVRRD